MVTSTPEVLRILSLLEGLIALKKVPIGTIENTLDVSQGYLARILRGDVHLRYQHLLDVLEIIGVTPGEFFAIAYPGQGTPDSVVSQLLSRHGTPPPTPSPAEIERQAQNIRVEDLAEAMVKKLIEKGAFQLPPAPKKPEDEGS